MRIKTVCEYTGLTDRTIRYYIEEKLICPTYTENYLGRKSFDFSHADICTLNHIAILRKFDFTIDEIRKIIEDETTSGIVISNVRHRTEESISIGEEKLLVLSRLIIGKNYTLEELAEELSKPLVSLPEHQESVTFNLTQRVLSFLKALLIFLIVWSPVAVSGFAVIYDIRNWYYPIFNFAVLGLTIISFWPTISVLVISRSKWKYRVIAKRILLVLCILSIPISFILSFGIVTRSETSDIRNYRRLDVDCLANRYSFYQELFPKWPHYFVNEKQPDGHWETVYLDAHYYYCSRPAIDYTYDIFAQWPLEKDAFDKEVARVKELFENYAVDQYYTYDIVQKENYTCLVLYNGDPPFKQVTNSYTYYIFAYDEVNMLVRYLLCDSLENGADQPYYLTLDWK